MERNAWLLPKLFNDIGIAANRLAVSINAEAFFAQLHLKRTIFVGAFTNLSLMRGASSYALLLALSIALKKLREVDWAVVLLLIASFPEGNRDKALLKARAERTKPFHSHSLATESA
ncbi:hypothetical protein H6F86_19615 [Phormidium sp. FACHB-592]|uniref:Uncharacterized protein n=1 Tax=Stenomitos frigidus AS-A4 TaxID=2933935 RepID=A0ABV0KE06_9CYAN|nr:hypothetical protein [Phormidium sp. FACHB-592]MBD2076036.1 hypothetical protein [Phormidium sp. FACHB-592]